MPELKMVMISYNEAVDQEVLEAVEGCGIKNYSKVIGTFGRGNSSGTHLGNDIWPGRNNLLYVCCPADQASQIIAAVRELRKEIGREGVKAFLLPLEETT